MPTDTAIGIDPRTLRRLADLLELGDNRTRSEVFELLAILGRIAPGEEIVKVQSLAALLARLCAGLLDRYGVPAVPI